MKGDCLNKNKYYISLILATVIIGVFAGIGANILGYILSFVENLFLKFEENINLPVSLHINPLHRLLSVFSGSIIAAICWFLLHKKYYLTGVNEALTGQKMSFIGTSIHDLIQTFYIGTGGSVGRESAPREFAAMIAQTWTEKTKKYKRFELTKEDTKLLIAAAAGAGLAGQYIAPLSGTLFSLEILYKKINKKSVVISLTMSIIATMIGTIRDGFKPYYALAYKNLSIELIPLTFLLGPILGFLGFLFRRYIIKAKRHKITNKKILISLPTAGLLTGIIAYFYPYIMGNGRGIAQLAYNTNQISKETIILLIICITAKAIITCYTIYSGAYGGILTPSISIGAALGILGGMIYIEFFKNLSLFECGLVGSVGFLSASQQAPLMALFLVFELCHLDISAFIPLGMIAAISGGISSYLQKLE